MRTTLAAIALLLAGWMTAGAQDYHYVQGHTTKNGYVQGHYQTNPNGTINDNWSTQGNTNPFTGRPGYIPQNPNQGGYNPQPQSPYSPYAPRR